MEHISDFLVFCGAQGLFPRKVLCSWSISIKNFCRAVFPRPVVSGMNFWTRYAETWERQDLCSNCLKSHYVGVCVGVHELST